MEPNAAPRPYPWRELLNPYVEVPYALLLTWIGYLVLCGYGWAPPLPSWRMQGRPPVHEMVFIDMCFGVAMSLYFVSFSHANREVVGSGKFAKLAEPERFYWALVYRTQGLYAVAICCFFAWTHLLGIVQSANGFDWNRRWPIEQPVDDST